MKKMLCFNIALLSLSLSTLISASAPKAAANNDAKNKAKKDLNEAERSCSPEQYQKALKQYKNVSDPQLYAWGVNRSLDTIACSCASSKNLKGMIQTNLALGGNATDTFEFDSTQAEAPFFWGYNRTALGSLARARCGLGSRTLAADVQQDINDAVNLLLEQDPANKERALHSALLDSASRSNLPAAKALLANGANPHKQLPYERNPLTVSSDLNAIESHSAVQAAQSKVRDHRRYRNEWCWSALKTTASFPFRFGILKAKIAMANSEKSQKDNQEELFRVTSRPGYEWNNFNEHRARLRNANSFLNFLKSYQPAATATK